jgi:tetratricopeptide (TPR) repeat protein
MVSSLYELLPRCTVKLCFTGSKAWGTGFFVAKGKILTCAHVVQGYEKEVILVIWQGQEWTTATVEKILPSPIDLALLQVKLPEGYHPPCVLLDDKYAPFDHLYVYGYPDDFPGGGSVTIDCDGIANDRGVTLIKAKAGQVRPGHSGSPALNNETGQVCGIVSETRGRSTNLGGLLIPVSTVFSQFPELQSWNKEIHEQDRRWFNISVSCGHPLADTPYTEFLYSTPEVIPNFQNRHDGIEWIHNFLNSPAIRIMFLIGRDGIGKTQMVSRAIKHLIKSESLDENDLLFNHEKVNIKNVGYLKLTKSSLIVSDIIDGLCDLLPSERIDAFKKSFRDPQVNIRGKMNRLLSEFPSVKTLLILDDFDQVLNIQTQDVENRELEEILCTLRDYPNYHPIKIIVISRCPPHQSVILSPEHTVLRWLNKGLDSPHAENYLRQQDGRGCLTDYSDEDLKKICARLYGFPKALDALSWTLQLHNSASPEDILNDAENLITSEEYRNVIEVLIGQEFKSLSLHEQQVMEILAVYNRPVSLACVDYLVKEYQLNINTKSILDSLGNKEIVQVLRQKKVRYFFLNSIDAEYAFSQINSSNNSGFAKIELLRKAADYFKEKRDYAERELNRLKYENLTQLVELALAEFDLRYKAQEYNQAAQILIDIGSSLLQLGNYSVVRQPYELLQSKITDPYLKGLVITELGTTYYYSGQYEQAIKTCSLALIIAYETENQELEGKCLSNIGNCYYCLGSLDAAIEKYQAALKIAREAQDKDLEAKRLNNLGGCYESLVEVDKAILHYKQALAITREIGNSKLEGVLLNHLGICYKDLGMIDSALEYHKQARDIARSTEDIDLAGQCYCSLGNCYTLLGDFERAHKRYEKALLFSEGTGDWIGKGTTLHSFAEVLIDFNQYEEALSYAKEGLKIGKDINSPKLIVENSCALARAHLYLKDFPAAYSSAKVAQEQKQLEYRYYALALFGLIAMHQASQSIAQEAFTEALLEVDVILSKNNRKFEALDIKALSLLSLTLCGDKDYLAEAKRAYQEARKISSHAGTVRRITRLFSELRIIFGDSKSQQATTLAAYFGNSA